VKPKPLLAHFGAGWTGIMATALPAATYAQQAQAESDNSVANVVVTAQRREQLGVYGRNLTDRRVFLQTNINPLGDFVGYHEPRNYRVKVAYSL